MPPPPRPSGPPKPPAPPRPAALPGDIFHAALERPPADRERYLAAACGADAALLAEVQALLAAHEKAGNFMPDDAIASPEIEAELARLKPEAPGDRIGPYKLLQQIGEGGFGVVWMAEQEHPVRRRVALKIIKLGMDTKEVIARFEQERQALAMMEHPNIARVFDAGATQYGRPFFVMELVRGVKITDYCDDQQLSTEERIALFIHVCQAVQHAHQKGVIHRDLKPSNILVTINDGEPVPKVIDFGVAKATQGRLTDGTLFTQFEQMIGTPLYMSPEQAELTSLDIDTRSDIYSLGVLLYELLTGRTPIDTGTMARAGMDEIRRIIREVDPPRPSARVKTLDGNELTTTAKRRHTDPAKLPSALRGDLDWIVMKCLEKDRKRRYETANGLALDLQRHLHHEIVTARPPTAAYLLGRIMRRHRGPVLAAGAVVLALCAGLIASTILYFRQREASARESAQRVTAEQTVQFLGEMLGGIDPDNAKGRDVSILTEMLERAAQRVETELKNQPEVEASLRATIGHVYGAIGQYPKAQPHLERAHAIRERMLGPADRATLQSAYHLGLVHRLHGRFAEAEALSSRSIERSTRAFGPEDRLTLDLQTSLADAWMEQGKFSEGIARHREVFDTWRRVYGEEDPSTLVAGNHLAIAYSVVGRHAEAEAIHRASLAILRRVLGPEHPDTLASLINLAGSLSHQNQISEAEKLNREAFEIGMRILGPEHPNTLVPMHNLAAVLQDRGRLGEAEPLLRKELEINRRLHGPESPFTLATMASLAHALLRQRKLDEAEPLAREAMETSRRILGREHPDALQALHILGGVLMDKPGENAAADAEPLFRQAFEARNRVLGATHRKSLESADSLARCVRGLGKSTEAEAILRQALETSRGALGPEHNMTLILMDQLAFTLKERGETEPAEKLFRESLDIARRNPAADPDETVFALWHLAHICERAGRWDETLALWIERWGLLPDDTILPLALAATQAWLGMTAEYRETCRRFFKQVEAMKDPSAADRGAKAFCILPSTDPAALAQSLALARRAVEMGKAGTMLPYYQIALGMAEFRNGNFAAADAPLTAAEKTSPSSRYRNTARFFRAMSLFRQGQHAEARTLFAAAEDEMPPLPSDDRQPFAGGHDHDHLILWLAYKEAKALLASAK